MHKICTKCNLDLDFSQYSRNRLGKYGLQSQCKSCKKKIKDTWVAKNKEHISVYEKRYREENKELTLERTRKWRSRNNEYVLNYTRTYIKSHRERYAAHSQARQARKLQAVPKLSDLDKELNELAVSEIYHLAKLRTQLTGIKWHVDHEVPLRSKVVCGLHYYQNLRVITAKENQMKSNRYWKDMP